MHKFAQKFTEFFKFKKNKPKVNGGNGKAKLILSKISGAFMLPIAVMAIAGLMLGIGSTIVSQAGNSTGLIKFGLLIKNLGDPVFGALPILFTAAFVIAFTNDAGTAVFSSMVAYFVFLGLQVPFIDEVKAADGKTLEGYTILFAGAGRTLESSKQIVGFAFGIKSMQTSIFGAIIVGIVVSYLYNKFYKIQLPQMISFFGGKRFVPIVSILAMVPISLVFLLFWPWVGAGLTAFGKSLNHVPYGFESLIFGFIERSLIPFGLHHAFYSPLWYTSVGGDVNDLLQTALTDGKYLDDYKDIDFKALGVTQSQAFSIHDFAALVKLDVEKWAGDSKISSAVLGLPQNYVYWKGTDEKYGILPIFEFLQTNLGLKVGRFLQGKYPFMQFGLPAAAAAMVFAAPKENRKVALSAVMPSALTALITGVTEPIEFTFLFLAPYMFWGFHAVMAGLAFMLMNVLGAHIGQTFSGGILDLIIYGIIPVVKGTHFWWWIVVGIVYAPIYFVVFYFVIKKANLETPGRGKNVKLFTKADYKNKDTEETKSNKNSLNEKEKAVIRAFGGWDNISKFNNCASRLRYDIKDKTLVNVDDLKAAGAVGVVFVGENHVQAIFGPIAEQLNSKLSSHIGEDLSNEQPQEQMKEEAQVNTEVQNNSSSISLRSVASGTIKELSSIQDGVFSEKMLGDGVVIEVDPSTQIVDLYAPFDGVVETLFPTKHAYGIKSKDGIAIMIHVGIDTVNLGGKGFSSVVKQGDEVKQGQLLGQVDMNIIRPEIEKTDIVYIVMSESSKNEVFDFKYGKATEKDEIFSVK
ncbi:PTS transporter subunit IIABC [Mycoplasma procyoni]|uniref:PTS transporter subunit IIABC n=1 Tax=Mycoplasma procyoni TaxID=568784 RepID=UPI00197B1C67|nr:PTS transporter subunit IIABC [Mycoplasma procyoni]MBN3534605.1 PTS transporter subunit EIIC [Mycoplasma procyoni]